MPRSWFERGCFGKYLIKENLFAVFFSFNSGIILLLKSPAIYIPHGRSCLMADKLRCMNQVKLLDINVCHQKQNKEIDGKRCRKRENQNEKESASARTPSRLERKEGEKNGNIGHSSLSCLSRRTHFPAVFGL